MTHKLTTLIILKKNNNAYLSITCPVDFHSHLSLRLILVSLLIPTTAYLVSFHPSQLSACTPASRIPHSVRLLDSLNQGPLYSFLSFPPQGSTSLYRRHRILLGGKFAAATAMHDE